MLGVLGAILGAFGVRLADLLVNLFVVTGFKVDSTRHTEKLTTILRKIIVLGSSGGGFGWSLGHLGGHVGHLGGHVVDLGGHAGDVRGHLEDLRGHAGDLGGHLGGILGAMLGILGGHLGDLGGRVAEFFGWGSSSRAELTPTYRIYFFDF